MFLESLAASGQQEFIAGISPAFYNDCTDLCNLIGFSFWEWNFIGFRKIVVKIDAEQSVCLFGYFLLNPQVCLNFLHFTG